MGLDKQQHAHIHHALHSKGIMLVTGKMASGKTFAFYESLRLAAHDNQVISFESDIEYSVNDIDQVQLSKNPLKDLQYASSLYNHTIGIRGIETKHIPLLLHIARNNTVVLETDMGVAGFTEELERAGLSRDSIAHNLSANVLSVAVPQIESGMTVKMSRDQQETLQQFISLPEINYLLEQHMLHTTDAKSFSDIVWHGEQKKKGLFLKKKPELYENGYYRAVVDPSPFLMQEQHMRDFDTKVAYLQKRALLDSLIPACVRGDVSLDSIMTLLRS